MIFPKDMKMFDIFEDEAFDKNIVKFNKYFGEDETKWKCINLECKNPSIITGQEIKVLDKHNCVSWERYGPLANLVFPLCHHCGSSLGQIYIPIKEKNVSQIEGNIVH
jgi:hypothetical protein